MQYMRFVYAVLHIIIIALVLFGSIYFIETIQTIIRPSITNAVYQWDGQTAAKPYTYHKTIPKEGNEYFELSMTMHVGRMRPFLWKINPDDCLEELWINDVRVVHPGIPYCDPKNTDHIVLYLEPYIHTGANQLRMRIRHLSWGVGAWIAPANHDPWIVAAKLVVALVIFAYGLWQFADIRTPRHKRHATKSRK